MVSYGCAIPRFTMNKTSAQALTLVVSNSRLLLVENLNFSVSMKSNQLFVAWFFPAISNALPLGIKECLHEKSSKVDLYIWFLESAVDQHQMVGIPRLDIPRLGVNGSH